jgi:tripartite-type tricarboxylate transporter receptor subunit TctC
MKRACALVAVLCLLTASLACGQSSAGASEDFYRGKTIRIIVGYGPGGGYDLYARLVAQMLPKFIAGHPTILVQNMPGAGSFVAAKYLYNVAPKDGTYFGSLAQTLALDSKTNGHSGIDAAKLPYLGRITSNIDAGVASRKSGITSFQDVENKSFTVGASGGGSTTALYPAALNAYAGSKFKLIMGYEGTSDIQLAMERGEVDVIGAYGLPGMLTSKPRWIKNDGATLIYQASVARHKLLPNVPTLPELASDKIGEQILYAIASTAEIGRSILTTPGVPPSRLALLRNAFQSMLRDPEFTQTAATQKLMVDGATGEAMDALVQRTSDLAPDLAKRIAALEKQ